jgi:ABC1 atypical kinase-like domain
MQSVFPILLTAGVRRSWLGPAATYQHRYFSFQARPHLSSIAVYGARVHRNVARLYARRLLEVAAASAAVQRLVVQLAADEAQKRPDDWTDWKGHREWSRELLAALGDGPLERMWAATRRIASISCLLAPFCFVLYPLSLVSETMQDVSWKYALWGIEQAGPTYIKLFQWATTRHDLFSPEFCRYFGSLQDKTAGHKWEETVKIIQQDLGLPPATEISSMARTRGEHLNGHGFVVVNNYLTLDTKPVGSGCIAQVYRGTLNQAVGKYEAGTEVAVKVQHPGIWHKVCVDFFIMGMVADFLEKLPVLNLKYLSLADSVRKFRDIMLPQLDLEIEAKNLERFNRDFAQDPSVTFPRPLNELTSTRVLTETFVHGKPILQYVKAPEAERKELALLGLNTTLKMIFLHDFLHGKKCRRKRNRLSHTVHLI